jgi:excisionase family DNA binding protein
MDANSRRGQDYRNACHTYRNLLALPRSEVLQLLLLSNGVGRQIGIWALPGMPRRRTAVLASEGAMMNVKANGSPATEGIHSAVTAPLLTVEEVAELLKVPVSWVYERTRHRAGDRIPGFRLGKYWRFRETDVLAWLERQRAGMMRNA